MGFLKKLFGSKQSTASPTTDEPVRSLRGKCGAVAVVMNSAGVAVFDPGLSVDEEDSVNEDMVRQWVNQDLERYPDLRAKAAAIEEIAILSNESISPTNLAEDMKNCYVAQMEANNWATPDGLHVFEAFLGPLTVYVAYGT
jgi:hypothetical protein